MKTRLLFVSLAGAACLSAATLTADYRFQGNLNDSLPGGVPLIGAGTLGATSYNFNAGQGLTEAGILADGGDYSIVLEFQFAQIIGFRKLVDFKSLTNDYGQYVVNGFLGFYAVIDSAAPPFTAGQNHVVILTRDVGTGLYSAYLDGSLALSFVDSGNFGVFTLNNKAMYFMVDDMSTFGNEASAGRVDRIRIFDGALSGNERLNLSFIEPVASVPEPGGLGFVGSAALALLAFRRRARV